MTRADAARRRRSRLDGQPEQPVALLIRLSVPGLGPHGGPNPEPTYGDQLDNSAIQRVKPEGKVVITYRERAGRFADGDAYSLRVPSYRLTNLGYGPLSRDVMMSPRIAAQLIGVGLIQAIPESAIMREFASAGAAG